MPRLRNTVLSIVCAAVFACVAVAATFPAAPQLVPGASLIHAARGAVAVANVVAPPLNMLTQPWRLHAAAMLLVVLTVVLTAVALRTLCDRAVTVIGETVKAMRDEMR